jgi:quinoprotein glucose dehydrogenase
MNTENGGGISTGGGLTFTGAATDGKFRAFDSRTGKELWVENLNADVNSIPITWQGKNGKQYVAAYAGAGARNGAKPTMLYVFSLP